MIPRLPAFVITATVAFVITATVAFGSPENQTPAEDDWWLPDWVKPTPNSGFFGGSGGPLAKIVVQDVMLPWRELNPQEDVYDWSLLDKALAENDAVWLRFFASDVSHCPEWLAKKYPDLKTYQLGGYDDVTGYIHGADTVHSKGEFYQIWDPRFDREFRKMLAAFMRAGYGQNPKIRFTYFPHGWKWNEFACYFIPPHEADAKAFLAWFKNAFHDYASAMGSPGHVVYTGPADRLWIQPGGPKNDYQTWNKTLNTTDGGNVLMKHCLAEGGGARNGWTEVFNCHCAQPDWGLDLKTIGDYRYSVINENHPVIRDRSRFLGTENEDFTYMWPDTNRYYYWKMAYLTTLMLRMNWVFAAPYQNSPEIIDYARLTLGKHAEDSPDAWVALRQYANPHLDKKENIRNFERWLHQRDIAPDGQTEPADRIDFPEKFAKDNGPGAWEALRTRPGGSMYFDVDDRFLKGGPHRVQIKVTYLDNFPGKWALESKAGRLLHDNQNDGKWKTATFPIDAATFENHLPDHTDFRLRAPSKQSLTVRFVRVIRLDPPRRDR